MSGASGRVLRKGLSAARRLSRAFAEIRRRHWFALTQDNLRIGPRVALGRDTVLYCSNAQEMVLCADVTLTDHAQVRCKHGRLRIGARSFIGINTILAVRNDITIGEDCQIAENATISDHNRTDACVLKGVTIGDDAVIAAGAVVTRNVPPASLVAGIPAHVLRM